MEKKIPTEKEIRGTISAARDSVWVINEELSKENIKKENVQTVQRNVGHLEIVMSNEHITSFGEDLSDITNAISIGTAFIDEHQDLLVDNVEIE